MYVYIYLSILSLSLYIYICDMLAYFDWVVSTTKDQMAIRDSGDALLERHLRRFAGMCKAQKGASKAHA